MNQNMQEIICNWSSYNGSHCRRNINNAKFCIMHKKLIEDFNLLDDSQDNLCETSEEIKIVPRNFRHLKCIMLGLQNEDTRVDVYMAGGLIEEADISNEDFIVLLSDSCRYYYYPPSKSDKNARDLKIILKKHCPNNCVVSVRSIKYCEECYKKLKNVPRLSVLQ